MRVPRTALLVFFGLLVGIAGTPAGAQISFTEHTLGGDPAGMYYRVGGSGPPLLLVHGFGVSGKEWDRFADDFASEFTVIIPDLPGHGESLRPLEPWDYEAVVSLLGKMLDELEVESAYAIGHSAGSTSILRMAISDLDRLRGMVLVGQTHRVPLATREAIRAYPDFSDLTGEDQELFASFHRNGPQQFSDLITQFRGLADDFVAYDLTPEHLSKVTIPTMVVMGDKDPFYPMDFVTEFYLALPNSALWVVPGQGHFPVWPEFGGDEKAAEDFPDRVRAFLSASG